MCALSHKRAHKQELINLKIIYLVMKETIKKHPIKIAIGTAVAVLLFVVYTTVSIMNVKAEMDKKQAECEDALIHVMDVIEDLEGRVESLEDSNLNVQVRLASIETKLTSIETLLIDLKKTIEDNDK